jgi:hypothetical protein
MVGGYEQSFMIMKFAGMHVTSTVTAALQVRTPSSVVYVKNGLFW